MKHLNILRLLLFLLSTQASASLRNAYGYIFGLGTDVSQIKYIKITTDNSLTYADGVQWHWYMGKYLRWYKNGLQTGKVYCVTVCAKDGRKYQCLFDLRNGIGDYKAPDIWF